MLEIIKKGDFAKALKFAEEHIAPFVHMNKYTQKIENYILFFAYKDPKNCPNYHLLDSNNIFVLSSKINQILNKGNSNFFILILKTRNLLK